MKRIGRWMAVVALAALAGCEKELPTAVPDPGGVTFDFQALSDVRFRIPSPGDKENLADASPWEGNSYCQIHHVKVPGSSPLLKEAKKAATWTQENGVCTVAKSSELVRLVGEEYAKVTSGAFTKVVRLPDNKGGNYRVSFRYRSRHSLGPDYGYLLVYFKNWDAAKKRWTKAEGVKGNNGEYFAWVFRDAGDWNVWTKDFTLPAGCEALEFVMRTDGVGDLSFRDFGLVSAKADTSAVTLALNPHGALGGDFAIGRGQCGGVGVTWKKSSKDRIDVSKCRFALKLPKGYAYLGDTFGATSGVTRTVLPDGSSEVSFAARKGLSLTQKFETWNRMLILVRAERDAEDGEAELAVRCEGKPLARPLRFTLRAVEPVTATKPKRFRNGVFTAGTSTRFGTLEANAAFADLMGACGVDWLVYYTGYYPQADRDFIPLWRKTGIRHLTPSTAFANGYYLTQRWAKMPKEDAFVGTHGDGHSTGTTWDQYMDRSMCPLAIVEERPFFRDVVVKEELVRQLKGTDGMWGNWEPFMFRGRGCNCAKCKAACAQWRAKTGGTVSDFRSMLHGKVVETVDRHVKRLTGGADSLGFIPGISWREMCSTWDEKKAAPEAKAVDYAGGLKWIDPWGPYVYWDSSSPYLYQKRGPLAHFVAARDIREQVDRDYGAGARPRLMSFPQGEQSGGWVTEPEWLEMAMDSFFFNRWDANVVYFFPQGYDARYWKAFAHATTRAAKYEDFVLDGTPADAKVELAPVREYAVPSGYVSTYLPKYGDVPLLQSAAFDRDGVRIVATFNFWDRGEAFFTLKAEMPEGRYAVVDEDGVRYAKGLSAADLKRGILLMTGAARTKVFEIVPSGKTGVAVPTCEAHVGTHYAARRPALAAAAEEDARLEASNKITTDTKGEL